MERAGGRYIIRFTRLRRRTCKTSRSSKKASHPASAQNVQDQSFKQKGLGAHGFGAERARLVIQVKKLRYAARRLFGELRFARGFKKSASLRRSAAYRGTSLSSWFQKTNASLSRFAAYRGTSLRSWFQKKCLLPMGFLFFYLFFFFSVASLHIGALRFACGF